MPAKGSRIRSLGRNVAPVLASQAMGSGVENCCRAADPRCRSFVSEGAELERAPVLVRAAGRDPDPNITADRDYRLSDRTTATTSGAA